MLSNIAIFTHFRISFCCFAFPPCPQVPLNPFTPICDHLHPFLIFFAYPPKTSCLGKFPRPYGPKPCPVYQHMLMLTLFSCPPAPTCPIAPIHTHLHAFALVHTLNYNVYMYYLLRYTLNRETTCEFSYYVH